MRFEWGSGAQLQRSTNCLTLLQRPFPLNILLTEREPVDRYEDRRMTNFFVQVQRCQFSRGQFPVQANLVLVGITWIT